MIAKGVPQVVSYAVMCFKCTSTVLATWETLSCKNNCNYSFYKVNYKFLKPSL